MKRVTVVAVGKLKDPFLETQCEEYFKRCKRNFDLVFEEAKDLRSLEARVFQKNKKGLIIALDERGKHFTSKEFAATLEKWMATNQQVVFLIGGADGLGDRIRDRVDAMLALSKMTVAHRLARLLFAEQLYRAVSIIEGTPYHRG